METVRKGGTTYLDKDGREITKEEYERLKTEGRRPKAKTLQPKQPKQKAEGNQLKD